MSTLYQTGGRLVIIAGGLGSGGTSGGGGGGGGEYPEENTPPSWLYADETIFHHTLQIPDNAAHHDVVINCSLVSYGGEPPLGSGDWSLTLDEGGKLGLSVNPDGITAKLWIVDSDGLSAADRGGPYDFTVAYSGESDDPTPLEMTGDYSIVEAPLLLDTDTSSPYVTTEDATYQYYNGALHLTWVNESGDWIDSTGTAQGSTPFASTSPGAADVGDTVDFNVLSIVQNHPARFFLHSSGSKFSYIFYSRHDANSFADRPKLIIDGGTPIECHMDVYFDDSDLDSTGFAAALWSLAVLHFDLPATPGATTAVLRLKIKERFSGSPTLYIDRPYPHAVLPTSPAAADGTLSDVVRHLGADTGDGGGVGESWTPTGLDVSDGHPWSADYIVAGDNSLTCTVLKPYETAGDRLYSIDVADHGTIMFARCIMKFHDSFNPLTGGKIPPGLSNTGVTYGSPTPRGYGTLTANGTQWGCRTNRYPRDKRNNFTDDWMGWSPYAYRWNFSTFDGEGPPAVKPLPLRKWFCIDQMIQLNTVSPSVLDDGVCGYWLDGECVVNMQDIEWITSTATPTPNLTTLISEFYLNIYIGGQEYAASEDGQIGIHSIKISKKLLPFDATWQALLDDLNGV